MKSPFQRFGFGEKEPTREAVINGERVPYDAMDSTVSLEEAKAFYSNYYYMGSSRQYYINGVLQTVSGGLPDECHFFILKSKA